MNYPLDFFKNHWRTLGLIALLCLIARHAVPYFPTYEIPHYDLLNVMHVINYLQSPHLFAGDPLSSMISHHWTITAPIYFLGLTYPLSYFLSAKGVVLSLGCLITAGCAFFAGQDWSTRRNFMVAFFILMLLLHHNVPPIEGNRRSFTAFFLLGILWLEDYSSFLLRLGMVGLAAGVYPPAALFLLIYLTLREGQGLLEGTRIVGVSFLRLFSHSAIFLAVLTPYWVSAFVKDNLFTTLDTAERVVYDFDSLSGIVSTLLVGNQGALFRDWHHFDYFLIFTALLAVQLVVLGYRFRIKSRYRLLLGASLLGWSIAHLLHPLAYHPFTYTRVALLLALAFPLLENLPEAVSVLNRSLRERQMVCWSFLALGSVSMVLWFVVVTDSSMTIGILGLDSKTPTLLKFSLALPIVFSTVLFSHRFTSRDWLRGFLVGLLLFGSIFLPHSLYTPSHAGAHIKDFEGLFRFLKDSPPGSIVAGPPAYFMDPIPAYGKRGIYSSTNKTIFPFVCERTKQFWKVYFHESPRPIRRFMNQNGIDYLLVDRHVLETQQAEGSTDCMESFNVGETMYLNQHFPRAAWSLDRRFYLITAESLQSF